MSRSQKLHMTIDSEISFSANSLVFRGGSRIPRRRERQPSGGGAPASKFALLGSATGISLEIKICYSSSISSVVAIKVLKCVLEHIKS